MERGGSVPEAQSDLKLVLHDVHGGGDKVDRRKVRFANDFGGGQGTFRPDQIVGGRHVRIEFRSHPKQVCQTCLAVEVDQQDPIAAKAQ